MHSKNDYHQDIIITIIIYFKIVVMLTLKTLSLPPSSPGSLTLSSACKLHKKRETTP